MNFIKKPYRYMIIFSSILFLFTGYVLLDNFVIPEEGMKVIEPEPIIVNDPVEVLEPIELIDNDEMYQDENIKIIISELKEYDSVIYVADIEINNIGYLKSAFANDTYGRNINQSTSSQAKSHNALLAINGDFYGFRSHGYVIRNGISYRSNSFDDDSGYLIDKEGNASIINEPDHTTEELVTNGAWQVWSFGPGIVKDGISIVKDGGSQNKFTVENPRTAIGYIDTNHFVFVVVDGRTSASKGVSLYELSLIMQSLGCKNAYNLDGGGSSTMWFNGKVINKPTSNGNYIGERKVSDIIYVGN